jgi:hypothetical protein
LLWADVRNLEHAIAKPREKHHHEHQSATNGGQTTREKRAITLASDDTLTTIVHGGQQINGRISRVFKWQLNSALSSFSSMARLPAEHTVKKIEDSKNSDRNGPEGQFIAESTTMCNAGSPL